jgi:endoglucanase
MSILAFALLFVASRPKFSASGFQNVVPNGHFESGGAVPDEWTSVYTQAGKLAAARDTATFLNTPASLSLTGLDEDADGNVSAGLPDIAGKVLTFSGSVRCAGAITNAQVALFLQDDNYKMVEWHPLVNRFDFKEGVWTPFKVDATIPENGKHARLILLIKGKGTVWLGAISGVVKGASLKPEDDPAVRPKVPPTPRSPNSPKVVSVGAVAPNVLEVVIQAGHVAPGSISPYKPQEGDQRVPAGHLEILKRSGTEIGWLIGVNHDHLVTYEHLMGDPLQKEYAGWLGSYELTAQGGSGNGIPSAPTALFRKSKPYDWEQPAKGLAMEHRIYLQFANPFTKGLHYRLKLGDINTSQAKVEFDFDPSQQLSEAVHISQVGYRPDDPFKRAYLSCWRGTGGGQTYQLPLGFSVLDAKTGKSVYRGQVKMGHPADEPEHMVREENFVRADVYWMDFSALTQPGTYRVAVDGIGASYPFPIANDVWDQAFKIQMRGLVNERSGIDLKPPYADFVRPADEMPNPGQQITESSYNALNGQEGFDALVKGDTGKPVSNASGGYHDAGDWNPRRVTHLKVTMAHLELLDIFPEHFRSLKLGLPDSSSLPDVLQEALWEVDFFRRLQKPDGGIPFGLETHGDPEDGDVSWLTTMHLYEFAPDSYGSWTYAAAAARVARLMAIYAPDRAATYKSSAVKAMQWAEAHYAEEKSLLSWDKIDARNLAAIEVYWLTKDRHWHDVFLENSVLATVNPFLYQWGKAVQRDAAFVYARLPSGLGNPAYKQIAKDQLEVQAKLCLHYAEGNGFNLTNNDKGRPLFIGFYTEADVADLCRAHYFTHKPEYLAGIVRACQFSTGANPSNLVYTTGLGINPIQHPLLLDSRRSGQPAPKGLTVYGPMDFIQSHDQGSIWPMTYYLNAACIPSASDWPIPEAYFDIFLYPMINEFTVDNWAGNVYAWGYLAGRK